MSNAARNDGASGESPAPRIAVLGLGNVLMGDDALGPWAIHWLLSRWTFPDPVAVQDLGTPGLDLSPFLVGPEAVILVDTVSSSGAPGELRLYRRDQILEHGLIPRVSPHDPALKETLITLELAGTAPRDLLLVGVIPESTEMEVGLSPAIRAAIPEVERAVLAELERLGAPARPREPAGPLDLWWEAGA